MNFTIKPIGWRPVPSCSLLSWFLHLAPTVFKEDGRFQLKDATKRCQLGKEVTGPQTPPCHALPLKMPPSYNLKKKITYSSLRTKGAWYPRRPLLRLGLIWPKQSHSGIGCPWHGEFSMILGSSLTFVTLDIRSSRKCQTREELWRKAGECEGPCTRTDIISQVAELHRQQDVLRCLSVPFLLTPASSVAINKNLNFFFPNPIFKSVWALVHKHITLARSLYFGGSQVSHPWHGRF